MGMSRHRLICAAAAAGLASCAGAVQARDWQVSVGGQVSATPRYEGADASRVRASPTLSVQPADRPYRFTPPDGGTSFALISNRRVEFGPMARFRHSRKDEDELVGFDKIKWAAEPGAYLDVWPASWLRLHGEARHGVAGHKGAVGDAGFDLVGSSGNWDFSLGGRAGWGDKKYMRKYFGVTAAEAARSPFIHQTYDPKGGRRYAGVTVGAAYHLSKRILVRAGGGYQRLAEKAGDSPIVAIAGSRNQYFGSVGVSYSFDIGL
jgi:outer membrane scaffolding protein for murein synthesis (MipA/OmpV family)